MNVKLTTAALSLSIFLAIGTLVAQAANGEVKKNERRADALLRHGEGALR
jgi:hypothetical protein